MKKEEKEVAEKQNKTEKTTRKGKFELKKTIKKTKKKIGEIRPGATHNLVVYDFIIVPTLPF